MKETLRDHPPAPRDSTTTTSGTAPPIDGRFHPTPGFVSHSEDISTQQPATTNTYSSGLVDSSATTSAATHTHESTAHHGTASTLPAGHGTGHSDETQSVVDRLNANIQQSVYEKTGRTDPDVAEEQPKTSAGKTFLEGLGLGGDERKTTLRNVTQEQ